MLTKPEYVRFRNFIKGYVHQQEQEGYDFITICEMHMNMYEPIKHVSDKDLKCAFRKICRELGLVDDGTSTGTYTKPEHVEVIRKKLRALY
jgi:hypothetical protein